MAVDRRKQRLESSDAFHFTDTLIGLNQSIAPVQQGAVISLGRCEMTRTSLQIPADLTLPEWEVIGTQLVKLEGAIQWIIGDWLNHGKRYHGDIKQAAEQLGFDVVRVYDYTYVASKVPFSVRTEKLTFGHHKVVAGMPSAKQRQWLTKAASSGWTVSEFRKAIKGTLGLPPPSTIERHQTQIASIVAYCNHKDTSAEERQAIIDEFRAALQALED